MLILFSTAAAAPPSLEKAWVDARAAIENGQSLLAVKIIDEALDRAPKDDSEQAWSLRILQVAPLVNLGREDDAKRILGMPLPPRLSNTAVAVRRLIALGWYQYQVKELQNAVANLEKARAIAEAHVPAMLPEALLLLSSVTKDITLAEEAVRLAGKGADPIFRVKAEISLFLTYTRAGRLADAVKIAEPMQSRVEALNLPNILSKYYGNAAWLYEALGDYEQAVSIYEKGEAVFKRAGNLTDQLTMLTNLGNVQLNRRDLPAAEQAYRQVLELTQTHTVDEHRSIADAYASLARVKLESGQIAEARSIINRAIALEKAKGDAQGQLLAGLVEARVDIAAGQYATAQKTLQVLTAKIEAPSARIEAMGQLARAYAGLKQNALAVKAFEDSVDSLRKFRDEVDDSRSRLTVFNLGTELFDDYIDFLVGTGRTEDALRVAETSRAQTLTEGLALPTKKTFDPKSLAKARKATILSYWLGRRNAYLWTVTDKAIKLTPLPKESVINTEVARYRDDVRTARATLTATADRGKRLYEMLIKPAGVAPNSRVILVPDRILHTLNFDTLVVPESDRRYWIEDVTLANASSLYVLASSKPQTKAANAMLVVGDPSVSDRGFPALAQAPAEIDSIRKQFSGAKVLTGAQATPSAYFAAKPERFQFIHFVAHGTASRIRPLDSAIILSPDGKRDARLTAREIAEGRLGAKLVTISSCEGAGSATYAGEGLVGLAWAFRRAGAEQVIAALWEVTDTAAPKLMDQMYAEIRAGSDPAAALRKAKLALLHSNSSLQQPRHWAPFVIYQ